MRRLLLSILLASIGFTPVIGQSKAERRIYLWDVTLSMKGYKGITPNIYDDVVKFLEQEIYSIENAKTEIIVLPFQESILDQWETVADNQGKEDIIEKIKSYKNIIVSNTNIVKPINEVKTNLIKPDKKNILYILTDGKQTGGNSELVKTIKEWGSDAKKLNAYALYVMLTKASVDQDVIKVIEETESIDVVKETIFLRPEQFIAYNIKEDLGKTVSIELKCKENFPIPENLKIRISAEENANLIQNPIVIVKNNKISFKINQFEAEKLMNEQLSNKLFLHLNLQNRGEILETKKVLVSINPDKSVLELIKNPEKKLTIRYE